jgi:signal transduction histidine kinase
MTTILTPEQIDAIRTSCRITTYGAPQMLDSGSFQALISSGLNLSKTTPVIYVPGQVICREGEAGDAMFLIRSGHAAIVKGEFDAPIVLACRGAGEFIGEMALLENLPRSASVVALDEVYLYHVTRDDFQRMLANSTKLDIGMLRKLSSRLREADDLITQTTHARRTLSSQVDELAAEKQQLMELQRLREETTDLVLHDLRNPLHSIMGAAGMLQMVLPPDLLQENRDLFTLINNNCERMQRLVDSLLDISRMESGETQLALEQTNLAQLIQAAISRTAAMMQARGIASSVFMSAHLPPVQIDADMIDRVIVNLLDNAIKFTPGGGQISVVAESRDDHVAVSIADTGTGIPPEQRPHIFERFARGTNDGSSARGFGLGLTFCKLAVEAHGGRIWVEDGEDALGCKFIFTLPLERTA